MGSSDRWQTFEACSNEANDLENMAALLETWFVSSVAERLMGRDYTVTASEVDILLFATRDIARRSKRVADMIGHLPR